FKDVAVAELRGVGQQLVRVSGSLDVTQGAFERLNRHRRRNLARLVTAHAIGYCHEDLAMASAVSAHGKKRVFVASAYAANVGGRPNIHQFRRKAYCMASLATRPR